MVLSQLSLKAVREAVGRFAPWFFEAKDTEGDQPGGEEEDGRSISGLGFIHLCIHSFIQQI